MWFFYQSHSSAPGRSLLIPCHFSTFIFPTLDFNGPERRCAETSSRVVFALCWYIQSCSLVWTVPSTGLWDENLMALLVVVNRRGATPRCCVLGTIGWNERRFLQTNRA